VSKFADPKFWMDTLDRAIATFAQAALATLASGASGLFDIAWTEVASIAGLAALISVLTSIAFRVPSGDSTQNRIDGRGASL
jgi:hypothetical protein